MKLLNFMNNLKISWILKGIVNSQLKWKLENIFQLKDKSFNSDNSKKLLMIVPFPREITIKFTNFIFFASIKCQFLWEPV